ncbi:chloride channel protein [Serinibacter salmoneus]|uniref:CIC family chloride channel protein n=1 Tax=Serinibacter salmoneus TaxID=556530 RepID=A0A2A9CZ49_9MICO|nr:ClC family H(+)/Cl(-) exchange transporter [Serinibacter salmoneus]PFG19401.1 CIC family chloride channel protein [Serinibacter salmoneus]
MRANAATDPFAPRAQFLYFVFASVLAGVLIGLVGGAFRWVLERAEALRHVLAEDSHGLPGWGWLLPVTAVALCSLAGYAVVQLSPRAAGSGIHDLQLVWHADHTLPEPSVVPTRFVGGILSIGSGLVVGQAGPTVHLGSGIGSEVGRWFRLSDYHRKLLYTTVGGAGLAVAFNTPLGGAMFTLEEVTKSLRLRFILIVLVTTSVAVGVSHLFIPDRPEFQVPEPPSPNAQSLLIYLAFGLVTGLLGVGYNRLVMGALRRADASRLSPSLRATLIGAVVGLLLWVDPLMVGGGTEVTQVVLATGNLTLWSLLALIAVRILVGPLSYAAGTAGGLFAPALAIGALWGALVQSLAGPLLGAVGATPVILAIVGMTAFFAATIRAPLTGIVLVMEMTGTTSLAVGMFAASAAAVLAASLAGAPPIYESLRERMLQNASAGRAE